MTEFLKEHGESAHPYTEGDMVLIPGVHFSLAGLQRFLKVYLSEKDVPVIRLLLAFDPKLVGLTSLSY